MNYQANKWKEECGVFGVYGKNENVSLLNYYGLYALQHRGQESAGIAITNGHDMVVKRNMGLVGEVFADGLPLLDNSYIGIGHVRYSTTGSSELCNTQPLMVNYAGGKLALAHNGNLVNTKELRNALEEAGTIFQSTMDTEVILNLIAKSSALTIEEKVVEALDQIVGAYCLCIMTENKLIAVRDPQGFRPLCLGELPGGGYVVASESCALDVVGTKLIRDIKPGEMVVISEQGIKSILYNENTVSSCVFEYIYFARPDSVVDQQSVYEARFNMGRIMAREANFTGDIVISVPDSGNTAALGYAYESQIPFAEGLMKNRYVGRTFIQPTQEKRVMAVQLKLNPISNNIKGKDVILVDDSIVRGTTSSLIVKMLRKAGAKSVKMVISSPPIPYPCYYGIDTSARKELIAASKSVAEIRDFIGVDELHFLSIDGLKSCFNQVNPDNLCYACFNQAYPTQLAK